MNGILNVLKPPGMTSFDVVAWLRRLTGIRKIGHTGTLDPMACGVLPICLGNATKAIEYMVEKDKLYRAELTLGVVTDTQDSYGELTETNQVDLSNEEIYQTFDKFKGKLQQTPPMYSAIKINGQKLYELARQGVTIERKPRDIEIYSIEIINIAGESNKKILFDVHCSKGTYIRTLCNDIGQSLGCGGHMSFLLRKRAGYFDFRNSLTLEEICDLHSRGLLENHLTGVDQAFGDYGRLVLDHNSEKKFINGVALDINRLPGTLGSGLSREMSGSKAGCRDCYVKIYSENGRFIALGELKNAGDSQMLKSKKLFI